MPQQSNAALLLDSRAAWAAWQRLARSARGAGLMFGWGLAEAIAWPIIPEFLLVPLAAAARERFYLPLTCAIVGSALGGTLVFLYAVKQPKRALALLPHLPAVSHRQTNRAAAMLRAHGIAALLAQPWTGIPLKVWAIIAGAQGLDPRLAIPTFVVGRAARMAMCAALASALGNRFGGFMRDRSLFLAAAYVVVFSYGWRRVSR